MDYPPEQYPCARCGAIVTTKKRAQGGGTRRKWCSHACGSADWVERHKERNRATKQRYADKPESKLKTAARSKLKKYWLKYTTEYHLLWGAKSRAKEKNLEFSISLSDIVIPATCPLLGIPIIKEGGKATENSPSLDRIDSRFGYTKSNIWVISFKANTAKSNLSLDELKLLVSNLEARLVQSQVEKRLE